MSMLITLAQLKLALDIALSDTSKDGLLTSSIVTASALVNGFIGYDVSDVGPRTFITVKGSAVDSIRLPIYPVQEVTSVSFDGDTQAAASYMLDPRTGMVLMQNGAGGWGAYGRMFDRPSVRVAVVYSAGYDPVPDDIQMVVTNIAAAVYNMGGSFSSVLTGGRGDLKSMTMFDAMSMSFETNVSAEADASGTPAGMVAAWAPVLQGYKVNRAPGMA